MRLWDTKWVKKGDRPADHLYNPGVLITGALQSFPPGGHIVEEVLHLHTGSPTTAGVWTLIWQVKFDPQTHKDLGSLVASTRFGRAFQFAVTVAGSAA